MQEGTIIKRPRTFSAGDIALTVLLVAVGFVFVILTILSLPAWWTTKFEWPPPFLTTLALASGAAIAFFIAWTRFTILRLTEPDVPCVSRIGDGRVDVWEGSVADRPLLKRLGARRSFTMPWRWRFRAPDEPSLARVLTALRDADIGFRAGDSKDWTPSDEFIALRERGLVSGTFYQFGGDGELCER